MDQTGPRRDDLSAPTQTDRPRFHLEWHLPLELGLPTQAALLDLSHDPAHLVAEEFGGDEVETLLNLWTTLTAHLEMADAPPLGGDAYCRRTGRHPERHDRGDAV
jgi:hypothetical protein